MINKGLFSSFFIERIREKVCLDDLAKGRMATLTQTWKTCDRTNTDTLWNTFLKQALSYLQFVPANVPLSPGVYKLFEDWGFSNCISVVYLIEPESDIDDVAVGRFWPAKLLLCLKELELNWGILTNGTKWRLYSTKSSRPYEDYIELDLARALEQSDEPGYGLFECFFHKDSFVPKIEDKPRQKDKKESASALSKCQLDQYRKDSEEVLDEFVKKPLLYQIDEVLQYLCNGFIFDTPRKGEEYTEEERKEIFENSVKLLYRCLFLFYAEARKLLPSEAEKAEAYERHSLESLCHEAHKFQWGKRTDTEGYDLWMRFKGLINAVNEGDPEYGIMGYNGGLFDDTTERFLGEHRLRNDFFSRPLYLLSYVEPQDKNPDKEYKIPYEDLEARHLGELYENILEYTVLLADADRIRRRTKNGVEIILVSETSKQKGDTLIQKGDVYFGESALERKQTGSYYTPEPIVQFLNKKAVIEPLREKFDEEYRTRFDQFLEQANSGYDDVTKRGAIRSALALIKRFVDEVILEFKVCDPAMGSGHFLVDAANQMVGLVVELLAELPKFDVTTNDITSNPNYWRRLISRNCLYGVDLNPLAVDLAKLSLWLNCFAIDHKLTFLDHHLREGNSLIGILSLEQIKYLPRRGDKKKKDDKAQNLLDYENLAFIVELAAQKIINLIKIEEDNIEVQYKEYNELRREYNRYLEPFADLYISFLIDKEIDENTYIQLFSKFLEKDHFKSSFDAKLKEVKRQVNNFRQRHKFFHWPLEFPDVFNYEEKNGFSAVIGNPPWDIWNPKTKEFFSKYDHNFRNLSKRESKLKIKDFFKDEEIKKAWDDYQSLFYEAAFFFKHSPFYKKQNIQPPGSNLYKLFLEQNYNICSKNGRIGIIVPSGFYTDSSTKELRLHFFKQSKIDCMYCFENRDGIFNIHRSFKFVLFCTEKGRKTKNFKCVFMKHHLDQLFEFDKDALKLDIEQAEKFSPDSLSIMEFSDKRDLDLCSKIYSDNHFVGDKANEPWRLKLLSVEFNMTHQSKFFEIDGKGYPLYEGKSINQFDHEFSKYRYTIHVENARNYLRGKEISKIKQVLKEIHLLDMDQENIPLPCDEFRFTVRAIARSTDERTLICTILPRKVCVGNSLFVGVPFYFNYTNLNENQELSDYFRPYLSYSDLLYSVGVLNSFVEDWIIRKKISANLNVFFLNQLPLPRLTDDNEIRKSIIARVARLVCTTYEFSDLWQQIYRNEWRDPKFWYPQNESSAYSYGPFHEQELRKIIIDQTDLLENKWNTGIGVYDRTQNRRDIGNGAQLRAEIDAYVAHLYCLTRDEFSYILDTFPVLKRKEEAAFGEFMSKRKCLEEYDRIESIL